MKHTVHAFFHFNKSKFVLPIFYYTNFVLTGGGSHGSAGQGEEADERLHGLVQENNCQTFFRGMLKEKKGRH